MITLITGTPGAGKTLYTVAEELPKFSGRPLFVDGIPDLLIEHQPFAGTPETWHEWAPEGAVLVVDEAQRVWRPRGSGAQVPPGVAALETHRHKGIDIVVITQHPNLIDQNVRRLVGRHIHVRRLFGWKRALVYEWDAATDPARVSTAIKRSWAYPKKAFSQYKSASMHQARGQRIPIVLVLAVVAALAVPVAGYYAYSRTRAHIDDAEAAAAAGAPPVGGKVSAGKAAAAAVVAVPDSIVEAMTPKDPQNPLSAPLYAAVAPVPVAPEVQGCIASRSRCTCYSQQQTPVWLPDDQCRQRAAGLYFDPYRQSKQLAREETTERTAGAVAVEGKEAQGRPASEIVGASL